MSVKGLVFFSAPHFVKGPWINSGAFIVTCQETPSIYLYIIFHPTAQASQYLSNSCRNPKSTRRSHSALQWSK